MNGRLAKKIRKVARKHDSAVAIEFRKFINSLPLSDRLRLAWKSIWRCM